MDFNYLEAKLTATDLNALIADFGYLLEDKGQDLQLVQSAILVSAEIVTSDPRQLAGQLTGRLIGYPLGRLQALLKQAAERKSWPWLRPLNPNLIPPNHSFVDRSLVPFVRDISHVVPTLDGSLAVLGSQDGRLRLWDMDTGQILRTFGGGSPVRALAVTSDARRAVSASNNEFLGVWDLDSGEMIGVLERLTHEVSAVVLSPDGRYVVVGDWDAALQIWDLQTMERRRTLHGSTSMIAAVAVTPDGRYVVSGSDEGIRIWELATGLCKMVLHVSTPGGPDACRCHARRRSRRAGFELRGNQNL